MINKDTYKRITEEEFDCAHCIERECTTPDNLCRYRLYCEAYNRLAELEDKIMDGTLVELPCMLGEKFVIKNYGINRLQVEKRRIIGYNFCQYDSMIYPVDTYGDWYSPKEVFETKEAAEAKLKELQEKEK